MTLAIFQLTKLGGKERACIEIARFLQSRGHAVLIFTTSINRQLAAEFCVDIFQPFSLSNHSRARAFAKAAVEQSQIRGSDVLLAFEKTPGADFCYAADCSWRKSTAITRWQPRDRIYLTLERGVFLRSARTRVFFLNEQLRDEYAGIYKFGEEKGIVLPLIVHNKRIHDAQELQRNDPDARANALRDLFDLPHAATVGIAVALNPRLKGVDRTLAAMTDRDDVHLVVVGSRDTWLRREVRRLGLDSRVRILPYVEDVMPLLRAADFLVHPARLEAGGLVIVESLLVGTPVIASGICGNARQIERYGAGISLPEPFSPESLTHAISLMIERLPSFRTAAAGASRSILQNGGAWLEAIAQHLERAAEDKFDHRAPLTSTSRR